MIPLVNFFTLSRVDKKGNGRITEPEVKEVSKKKKNYLCFLLFTKLIIGVVVIGTSYPPPATTAHHTSLPTLTCKYFLSFND